MNIGMCHFMCTEIKETIEAFNQVIEMIGDKQDPAVHYTLGIAYIMGEQYGQALEQFNKSIEIDPSTKNYYYRGLTLYNLDRA